MKTVHPETTESAAFEKSRDVEEKWAMKFRYFDWGNI